MPFFKRCCLLIASWWVLAAVGCGSSGLLIPASGFDLQLGRAHPLSGRVFSVAEQSYITSDDLYDALQAAQYVLLGETHDNRDHHRLQAQLLERFLDAHASAQVGFEMLDEADAAVLARHSYRTAEELASQVAWQDSGWPEFALYAPVFRVALAHGAPVVAAHPSTEHVRASMSGVAAEAARALRLDAPLPDAQIQAQYEEIRAAHCGHAPDAMLSMMQRAQAYKDAFMARAIAASHAPTALIAGRGHIRKDRAVPLFLQRAGVGGVVSVAFEDVDDARSKPSDYDLAGYDFVVFTPRVSDEDPCVAFRKQLEQMQRH